MAHAWEFADRQPIQDALVEAACSRIALFDPVLPSRNQSDPLDPVLPVVDDTKRRSVAIRIIKQLIQQGSVLVRRLSFFGQDEIINTPVCHNG